MLTKRGLVLVKSEASYGVDPTPTAALNSLLVFDPVVSINTEKIERDVVRPSISAVQHLIGKKYVELTFSTELKGSGLAGTDPEIADLLLACGMAETYGALGSESLDEGDFATHVNWDVTGDFVDSGGNAAYTHSSGAGTLTQVTGDMAVVGVANKRYAFTYTVSSPSGDAAANITSAFAAEATSLDLTAGTHTTYFIASAGAATADFVISATSSSGGFTLDDLSLKAVGSVIYTPASSSLTSATVWVYLDGICHKINGCYGNMKLVGEAGMQPRVEWTLQGLYSTPTDLAIPTGSAFDSTEGPVFMAATFTWDGYASETQKLEIDLGVELGLRDSITATHGYAAVEIVGRKVVGSFNPLAVTEATQGYWADFEAGTGVTLNCVIGSVAGNIITIASKASACTKDSIAWGDRNGSRIYDIPFSISSDTGDDEITVTFT